MWMRATLECCISTIQRRTRSWTGGTSQDSTSCSTMASGHYSGKMRAVFDSSAMAKDGTSLNKALHCGPKLQTELPEVLMRWREDDVAYQGDIVGMFSQVRLSPEDAKLHRFLWKFPGDTRISVLQMDRV